MARRPEEEWRTDDLTRHYLACPTCRDTWRRLHLEAVFARPEDDQLLDLLAAIAFPTFRRLVSLVQAERDDPARFWSAN
jgi:hypothetical protein